MSFDAATAADLARLTEALDRPGSDLAETMGRVADSVRVSVPSLIGLTVRTGAGDLHLGLTSNHGDHDAVDVRASLMLELAPSSLASSSMALTLFATTAGAFVDLAADLAWLTGQDLTSFALDRTLSMTDEVRPGVGIGSLGLVNQAIGVLLGRGFTPEAAERELYRRATASGTGLPDAARAALSELIGPGAPDDAAGSSDFEPGSTTAPGVS